MPFEPLSEGVPDLFEFLTFVQSCVALGKSLSGKSFADEAKAIEDAHLLSQLGALVDRVKAQVAS